MSGEFNFDLHAAKRIDYIGVTFRTRSPEEVREIVRLMRADLWPAVEAGKLSLPIDKTFPLEEHRGGLGDDARQRTSERSSSRRERAAAPHLAGTAGTEHCAARFGA